MTEEINKGCEFQSDCIEYKDISYLKVMPICAIHELSIACHDKVNKCKYYKLYKQLQRLKQENEELKKQLEFSRTHKTVLDAERTRCKQALEEIRVIVQNHRECFYGNCCDCKYKQECDEQNTECDCAKYHIDKINEVLDE